MKKIAFRFSIIQMLLIFTCGLALADDVVNISNSPNLASTKPKMEIATVWFDAKDAAGNPVTIENRNEDGVLFETRTKAKPIVIVYAEEGAASPDQSHDIIGAVSRDEGQTWHKTVLSYDDAAGDSFANLSTFTVPPDLYGAGTVSYGHCVKPLLKVKSNNIFAIWYSKYAPGGEQKYRDYSCLYPEVGVQPYNAVWVCRGVIVTQKMITSSPPRWAAYSVGDIVWYQPEQLSTAIRDAKRLFPAGAGSGGFALAWQEDPKGLEPGGGEGPGPGWGGANVSKGTDIWYSYITWGRFQKVLAHDYGKRPVGQYGMSDPVPISNNGIYTPLDDLDPVLFGIDADNIFYLLKKYLPKVGKLKPREGASRCTMQMQRTLIDQGDPADLCDDVYKTYTLLVYEEKPGNITHDPWMHQPGHPKIPKIQDIGKNILYHTFEFDNPPYQEAGDVVNLQMTDEFGEPMFYPCITNEFGEPIPMYENARRPRILSQGKAGSSGTWALIFYKSGLGGCDPGSDSDILMRRIVKTGPPDGTNPYFFSNIVDGEINISATSVYDDPGTSDIIDGMGFAGLRQIQWEQTTANLDDKSYDNPLEDARAHRGAIRGNLVLFGYSWTPTVEFANRGYDTYNYYIRRSTDGGATWPTVFGDPGNTGHPERFWLRCMVENVEVSSTNLAANMSLIPVFEEDITNQTLQRSQEPRLVAVPGTITAGMDPLTCEKIPTGYAEDVRDTNVSYTGFGTEWAYSEEPITLRYNFTQDKGATWSMGTHAYLHEVSNPWQKESQFRMTPDGSKFYTTWFELDQDGGATATDVIFRRIMPSEFAINNP